MMLVYKQDVFRVKAVNFYQIWVINKEKRSQKC